jgi:hypothetical protein
VDETITSSLVAHLGYGISGNGTATGVILNDDMFSDDQARVPTIESRGNTALQRRLGGKGFAQVGPASRRVIRSPWGGASELLGDWQMLAAETVADQNQILLRNNPGNVLQVWNLTAPGAGSRPPATSIRSQQRPWGWKPACKWMRIGMA